MQLIEESRDENCPEWMVAMKAKQNRRHNNSYDLPLSANTTVEQTEYSSTIEISQRDYGSHSQLVGSVSMNSPSESVTPLALPRKRTDTMQSETDVAHESGLEPEIIDLTLAFLGPSGKIVYQVALFGLTFTGCHTLSLFSSFF